MDKLHSITRVASMAISAWRFVDSNGGHAVNALAAVGVSEQAVASGMAFSVVNDYSAPVEAAEALSAGDLVRPAMDGSGRAVKGVPGDCCGRVLVGATLGKLAEVRFLDLASSLQGIGGSVVAAGDSSTLRINGYQVPTAVTRTAGVATCALNAHGLGSGQLIDFNNATDQSFNVRNVPVARLDANNYSFPAPGPDGAAVAISGRALITTVQQQLSDDGYWVWLNAKLGGALRLVRNAGVASNTAPDILARFAADVAAYPSDWIFLQLPLYNDIVNAGYTLAQLTDPVTGYYSLILQAARATGRKVLLLGPTAFGTGNTAARYQIWLGAQKWMREQARALPNVFFADVLRYQVSATAATPGNAIAGMLAADGFHESARGSERKAQAIVDAIGSLIPRINLLTTSSGDNYGTSASNSNVLDYAPWTNVGGTVNAGSNSGNNSGTVGAGWQVDCNGGGAASTAVWSTPARADGIGFDLQCVFTPAANNAYVSASLQAPIPIARAPAGTKLRLTAEIALTGVAGSGLRTINALIAFQGGANPTSVSVLSGTATNQSSWLQSDATLTLVSNDITVPSDVGISGFNVSFYFVAGGAGTAVTIKVGRVSIEKVG